jgi:hypothetical protein
MLEELNNEFALQLDPSPLTDWSCQSTPDTQSGDRIPIVLAGSSHSTRLIDLLESACLFVLDSMVLGIRIMESSVASMPAGIEEKVTQCDILAQLLDSGVYQCKTVSDDCLLPRKVKNITLRACWWW